jgi:hypothetical protein
VPRCSRYRLHVIKRNRALLITATAVVVTVAVCAVGLVIAVRLPGLAGCEEGPPYVSAVQADARRLAGLIPELAVAPSPASSGPAGGFVSVHYRWREARPRTCPDLGPMDHYYEGFAVLAPERAQALRTAYTWTDAVLPTVPAELAQYSPPGAAWQRSADLDAGSRADVWLDRGSDTVYFSLLRS